MSASDAELVVKAKAGDVRAFDELVSRHQERVFALAYHMLGDFEDAADVQQEAFLLAWKSVQSFRGQASFGTWLYKIALNSCTACHRRKGSVARREDTVQEDSSCRGSNTAVCQDRLIDAIAVRQLLNDIPDRHRSVLLLREVDGMSIDEIAQVTGSSRGAVVQQLWRVRKSFRERLRKLFAGDEK